MKKLHSRWPIVDVLANPSSGYIFNRSTVCSLCARSRTSASAQLSEQNYVPQALGRQKARMHLPPLHDLPAMSGEEKDDNVKLGDDIYDINLRVPESLKQKVKALFSKLLGAEVVQKSANAGYVPVSQTSFANTAYITCVAVSVVTFLFTCQAALSGIQPTEMKYTQTTPFALQFPDVAFCVGNHDFHGGFFNNPMISVSESFYMQFATHFDPHHFDLVGI